MKITFLGAAKTVTGSCYLVETRNCKFLVDCGLFQGHAKENILNEEPFPFNPSEIEFILLTHAHIDHSGRIPKIFVEGFKGEVYATSATVDLCSIMLPDCGHIQEIEKEWINRKRERAGKPLQKPIYTYQDALDCMSVFKSVAYEDVIKIKEDIKVRYNDAGHMLGSAIIEVWINDNGEETKVVFSGDLGNKDIPLIKEKSIIESADYLVIESTYGNRLHQDSNNKVERFIDILDQTLLRGGNVIIPSFAVGRTQEIIFDLHKQHDKFDEKIKRVFNSPVFVDSPLAISATEMFRKHLDYFDEEAKAYIENGNNPLDFPGLQFTRTPDESRALNERMDSIIIISASGMCEAGRIKHHLKHNLWRKESTILFVGYQAIGTLGRRLIDGAKRVKLFGEDISVNAQIESIDGFSGHADRDGLMEWLGKFNRKPKQIFIVHGEEGSMKEFAQLINNKFNVETCIPEKGETFIINARRAMRTNEKPEVAYNFKRLAVIEMMDTLKEEFDELSEIIKLDLKEEKTDVEVDEIRIKLKNLEKSLIEILR